MNIAKFEQQRKQLGKVIAAIVLLALLWCIYGVTIDAGAQTLEPTPVCTMTPSGELCTSSVATTGTPTATPVVPPTVPSTLTPFEPTSTPAVAPTATNTPTPRPTITVQPVPMCIVEVCVYMPIVR